jgi:hypothetical protein
MRREELQKHLRRAGAADSADFYERGVRAIARDAAASVTPQADNAPTMAMLESWLNSAKLAETRARILVCSIRAHGNDATLRTHAESLIGAAAAVRGALETLLETPAAPAANGHNAFPNGRWARKEGV